jgi:hypothetical protein
MINLQTNSTSPGQKFSSENSSFDIQPAEVIEVNYKDISPEQLYNVKVVPLTSEKITTKQMAITARPLDYNIKKIPLVGEIVLLLRGPSAGSSAVGGSSQNYYLTTYSVQSLVHHNAIPDVSKTTSTNQSKTNDYSNAEQGHLNTNEEKNKTKRGLFAKSFKERNDVRPIQFYAGDVIIEGRFNHGIRFSSTLKEDKSDYTIPPSWLDGQSKPGDPITIIRNGRRPGSTSPKPNKYYVEKVDDDLCSIYLTSGQQIPFTPQYSNFKAIDRLNINTFKVGDNYSGNQIGLFSDRIILASKSQEVLIQSEGGVAINTAKSFAIDVDETFEINSSRINLGLDAEEPALLGDTTGDWLNNLLQNLIDLLSALTTEIHPTGTGPSGPPINAPQYASISGKIQGLKSQIPLLKSELVFLNKNKDGGGEINEPEEPEFELPELSEEEEQEYVLDEDEKEELQTTSRLAEQQINDPSVPPEAKAAAIEKKQFAETELSEGKKLSKQNTDDPITNTAPSDPNKNKSLREKINNTPEKYKCAIANRAIEAAIGDIGIMEYSNVEFPGGMNFGGFKDGVNRQQPGRIDEMISNAGLNNKAQSGNYTREGFYWCASATTTWWKEGGIATPGLTGKASCENWKQWAIKNGYWSKIPKQGALIVYAKEGGGRAHHIGMVVAVAENGAITSIEGNTGGKGFDRNGGGCFVKNPRKFDGFIIPPGCK